MSVTVMPNTGIMQDDRLDKLRADALFACREGLPEAVVYYLRAIEGEYLDMKHHQRKDALREIGWKHVQSDES